MAVQIPDPNAHLSARSRFTGVRRAFAALCALALAAGGPPAIGQTPSAGDSARSRGLEASAQGRHAEALRHLDVAREAYRASGNRWGESMALLNMGEIAQAARRLPEAADFFAASVAAARSLAEGRDSGAPPLGGKNTGSQHAATYGLSMMALERLGRVRRTLGEFQRAAEAFEERERLATAAGDTPNLMRATADLGRTYVRLHRYPEAIERLRQSLNIANRLGERENQGAASYFLGTALLQSGDYAGALEHLSRAAEIAGELHQLPRQMETLHRVGAARYRLGQYDEAIAAFEASLAIARRIGDKDGEAQALSGLGSAYYFQGKMDLAIAHYEQALALARKTGNLSEEGKSLGNLALAHSATGDHEKALPLFHETLQNARARRDPQDEAQALGNLGTLYIGRQDWRAAAEHLEQSSRISGQIGYSRGEATALTNLAFARLRGGDAQAAANAARLAVARLEQLRALASSVDAHNRSLFETQLQSYRLLQIALVAQGQTEEALEISERGRAQPFADMLGARWLGSTPSSISAAEMKAFAASRRATLVEYALQQEDAALYIWVVLPDERIVFQKVGIGGGGPDLLEGLVTELREEIAVDQKSVLQDALSQMLVEPIAKYLPTDPDAPVVFIPQGPLFLVPWAQLQHQPGRMLIEAHTVAMGPSIQVLRLLASHQAEARPDGTALIVGRPRPMPRVRLEQGGDLVPLSDLEASEQEALSIGRLLGAEPLIGERATKAAVTAALPGARIVHFATHGLLEAPREGGVPGALALAVTEEDDGLLSADEIATLRFGADLVVLSACRTGEGRVTGDGVVGLQRAFASAGARTVVMSLWAVADRPSAEAMEAFYRQRQSGVGDAQALRRAMLEVRERHPSARDWAGFAILGGFR